MTVQTPSMLLRSVVRRNYLVSAWPWRGVAYAISTAIACGVVGVALSCVLSPLLAAGAEIAHGRAGLLVAVPLGIVGVALLAALAPPLAVVVARVERWRLRLTDRPAYGRRTGSLYRDPATWSALAYLLILAIVAPLWLGAIALFGLLIFALLATPYAVPTNPNGAGTGRDHIVIGSVAHSSWRSPAPAPGWSTRSTPNAAASNATCTTVPSSIW